jgi:GT2 family glycosyltransferase
MRIAVLLACHNRRAKTLECLDRVAGSTLPAGVSTHIVLTDDGSTDGTREAVLERYPEATVLAGDGSLFWNGAMRRAYGAALARGYDAYLWLNDDTMIDPRTIARLIEALRDREAIFGQPAVIVGSTRDPETGQLTYGGVVRPHRFRPFAFEMVEPATRPVECESMWGNCVLIPHSIARVVGNLDAGFSHSIGDVDYGLRVRAAGFRIWVMPGFAGTCSVNSIAGTYQDPKMPLGKRLRRMLQPKGLPIRPWRVFTRRHGGPLWPVYFLWPYFRVIASSIVRR